MPGSGLSPRRKLPRRPTPSAANGVDLRGARTRIQLVVKTTSAVELEKRPLVNSVGVTDAGKRLSECWPFRAAYNVSGQS